MTKQQAQQIIRDTFESSFDKNKFTGFIKNLLNRIEDAPFTYRGSYIPDAYKQYIKTLERIGKFSDGENNIDILVITLQKETSLERARTMQRNFVAWYLNGSRGGVLKDAALAAFVSPDKTDWRFSLVKMEYKFEKTKTGKVKVKEEFTPARRWSFLVGANEKSHTAQSRLVKILANDEQAPTLEEIEKAFDIETVTKEFFLKYRELFLRIKEELDRVVKNDMKVEADFNSKGVDTVNFAKKLLGQIIFLYFLQKKGWFGVERDADWGEGSKHFMRELFESKHGPYKNFFNDILEPLFYDALSRDRSDIDHWNDQFKCKIPFLNGGLFDPIGNYSWYSTDILLPDKLFSNTNKTKEGDTGDGILDIFDRYNFTVKEDEPLEKEVAIDPELLGKAYEKFNAIRPDNYDEFKKALKSGKKGEENKFNKKFGVYYTPREIVHYMCQQSLINYLSTELDGKASKEDIETLIHIGEHISENEVVALIKEQSIKDGKQKTSEYKLKLTESIRKNAALIDDKLADITVCDPAVGSGAFPVGMMHEIVRARNVFSVFLNDNSRRSYEFKRRCIEHSLYGVDIDPGAVEIAKLRLWLSLVVDEDDIKNIKPLPNLEYKIVRGNSLIGFPENWDSQISKEIEELKHKFFSETNPSKKIELKKHIDDKLNYRYENSLKTFGYKIDFDFKMVFSEVFHQKGGFDVVIANPPYVFARESKKKGLTTRDKKYFYNNYKLAEYQVNLYPLFIEKGTLILCENGCLCFITPNNWLTINANKSLRKFTLEQSDILIVNFLAKVFESAAVDSSILIFRKSNDNPKVRLFEFTDGFNLITKRKNEFFLSQNDYIINIQMFKGDDKTELIHTIDTLSNPLSSLASVKVGLKAYQTGKGEPPQTEDIKQNRVYHSDSKLDETYFPYLHGKDVSRYFIDWSGEHLKYGDHLAEPRRNFSLFSTQRILVRQIPSQPPYCIHACLIDETYLNDLNSMNIIDIRDTPEYVLGILNSSLVSFWFVHKFGKLQRGTFPQFKVKELAAFPLPKKQMPQIKDRIDSRVRKILEEKKHDPDADTTELDREIDQMVYQLYGLTPEEIKSVEGGSENAD